MRCYFAAAIALLMGVTAFSSPAYGGDTELMRWLGIGWGPGYHAYSNCGPCANGYARPSGVYGGGMPGYAGGFRPAPTYREPLPAAPPREPLPPRTPEPMPTHGTGLYRPPLYGPAFSAPLAKPSEQAARTGRYFPPSPEYSPTYVGQRYPAPRY